jgi:hypothetical protein
MIPVDFTQSNTTLTKPTNMTDEECSSLRVYNDGEKFISCWRPSWRERLSVLFFGKVWIWIFGQGHPPVYVEGNRTVFGKPDA